MPDYNYNYAVDLSDNNACAGAPGNGFDAEEYAKAGHKRIILKASQGVAEVDSCFRDWYASAVAEGLWVSAYHFADDSGPAATQGAHFASVLAGCHIHHRIVDIEQASNIANPVAFRAAFGGHADLLYSDAGYLEQYDRIAFDTDYFWVAAYPNLPAGCWSGRLWGHQYSDTAKVKGIATPCDLSLLR